MGLLARLHPLIVHFPVALVVMAALFELRLVMRRDATRGPGRFCLSVALLSALAAALTGWLNAEAGAFAGPEVEVLERHRVLAFVSAGVLALTWLLGARLNDETPGSRVAAYRLGLTACVLLVSMTGHFGGTLVHGEGYLFGGDAGEATPAGAPEAEAVDFASAVRPIYEASCIRCHGPRRARGDLRLDTLNAFERRMTAPGNPEASRLLEVVQLDPDDPDHMPLRRPSLEASAIETLRRWIAEGAVR